MAHVALKSVSKIYPDGTTAVEDLSLSVADREFLVLVGPSGCGKSTTLRLMAGLERPSQGEIWIGDRMVNQVAPKDRDIAMVFQNYALYPHMSVYRNLSFGLELRYGGGFVARFLRRLLNPRHAAELSKRRRGIDIQVRQAAARLNIESLLDRKPHQLSGGERQRVALGRAIVRDPAAFLFDEPLSNLDAKLRQQMRTDLKQLHQSLAATMIYVTHDQIEAMTLGDRVAVMNRGQLQQLAAPETVYHRPANLFVARFFGSTPINLVAGHLLETDSGWCFQSGDWKWRFRAPPNGWGRREWPKEVLLGFRGEDLKVTPMAGRVPPSEAATEDEGPLTVARVCDLDRWGDANIAYLEAPVADDGRKLPAGDMGLTGQTEVRAGAGSQDGTDPTPAVWCAKLPSDLPIEINDQVSVRVAVNRCLWFDPQTEQNLSE